MNHLHRLVSCATVVVCSALPAQADDRQYGIREDQPSLGSSIRRYEVHGSALPINKRYHEFTAAEKAQLHQLYEHIAPGDEPPFPADGLKPIFDAIRKAQAKRLAKGRLDLIVSVDAAGEATEVKAVGSPDPEMVKLAASVLLLTRYKPAICAGKACRMEFPIRVDLAVR